MNEKMDQDHDEDERFILSPDQSFNLLESISEAFYGLDSDWRFIYVNHKAEQLWGRKREELIGKQIWTEFPQSVNTQAYQEMHRALAEQQTVRFESFSSFLNAWVEIEVYPTRTGLSIYFHDITQRKNAEAALEKSQKQLQLITDSLPLLISYVDSDMRYQFVNNGYEKMFGLEHAQIIGRHISEIVGQTAFEAVRPEIEATLSGETVRYERPISYSTGTRFTRTQLLPHRLDNGAVVGFISMVDDITDRKQAEEGLEYLAAIVTSSNDAIVSETLDGIITSWNQGAEKIFGYESHEVIQKPVNILIPPEKLGEEAVLLGKMAAGETVRNYDTIRVKKDSSQIFVSVSLSPLKDGQGKIVGASKIAQDVTERKRAEGALRRYGERMAAINHLDHIISSNLDITQVYDSFVKELQALMPLDRTAIVRLNENGDQWQVARQWTQHIPAFLPGDWRLVQGSVIEWLVTNRIPFSEPEVGEHGNWPETAILQREGIRSRLLLPLIIEGRVVAVLTVASRKPSAFSEDDQSLLMTFADQLTIALQNSDLYEQIKRHAAELEQRVTERTAQLEASNKELEAFSYSVSHDLRSPLRAIDGFSRILVRDYAGQLPVAAERYLRLIRDNTRQMGTLIDDLLTFSRLNRQPLNKQQIGLSLLVRQVYGELTSEEHTRQVELVIADLPDCQADPTLFKQVIVNLMSNALKFTSQRNVARIEVNYQQVDGEGVYSVRDNGAGFDMAYADKLFGVFQRLHRTDEFPGTGVGLAIVNRIIHRHGGRIWAEAAVDQGATFYFTVEGEQSHD